MIGYWCLILSGLAFCVNGVEMGDTTLLQKTVEHLVNYTALEAFDELNLNEIGNAVASDAHFNYARLSKESECCCITDHELHRYS